MIPTSPAKTRTDTSVRVSVRRPRPALAVVTVFLLVVAAQASVVIALNVVADPHAQFGTGLMEPLVERNERKTKTADYALLGTAPRTLVLGSSRSMKLAPTDITNETGARAFNFAISASTAINVLGTYRAVSKVSGAPREIVYGIEPDQLFTGRTATSATAAGKDAPSPAAVQSALAGAEASTRVPPPLAKNAPNLAATYRLGYLLDSLDVLRYTALGYPPKSGAIDTDGLFHYLDWESRSPRAPPKGDPATAGRDYERMDLSTHPVQAAALRALVDEAVQNGTEVRLFLTPLYPPAHDAVYAVPGYASARNATLQLMTSLCGPHVHVQDFEDVASFGGSATDFRDFVHYGPDNARALVHALYHEQDLCDPTRATAP